jgi:Flp pilus assembly protein TadB
MGPEEEQMTNQDTSGGHACQHSNRHPRRRTRGDYERGLPDYHDPTAGFGGAPPAYSALTLRAVLAGFGLVFCTVAAVIMINAKIVVLGVVFAVLAAIALVDLVWVLHRKRRGEPG